MEPDRDWIDRSSVNLDRYHNSVVIIQCLLFYHNQLRSKICMANIGVPQHGQLCVVSCSKTEQIDPRRRHPYIGEPFELQPEWNYRNAMRNTLGIRLISPVKAPCGPISYGNRPAGTPSARWDPPRSGFRARTTKNMTCLGNIHRFPTFRQNHWSSARQVSTPHQNKPNLTINDIGLTAQVILNRAGLVRQVSS